MEVIEKVISFGISVAAFLSNTSRGEKALELCKECLILLDNRALGKKCQLVKFLYSWIYDTMFNAYCFTILKLPVTCQSRQTKLLEAQEIVDKAVVYLLETGNKEGEAGIYENLGTLYSHLSEYDKAEEYHKKALAIGIEIGDRGGEARGYDNLGTECHFLGKNATAKEYYEKALEIRKEIGDRKGEAIDYGKLGAVFLYLSEYFKAKKCLEKALAIRMEIGYTEGEATDYGNLAAVYVIFHEYPKAKEHLENALSIRKKIGDRRGEAADYANLGSVFLSLGEYVKAKEYFEKALAIRIEIGERSGQATDYANLAVVFKFLGKRHKSKEYLEKALAINIETGERRCEAQKYCSLGVVSLYLGEYVKAEEYHEKALAISKQIGDRRQEATQNGNLGIVFLRLREYVKAVEYLEKAISISRDIGDGTQEFRWLCDLALTKLVEGKMQEATRFLFQSIEKGEELRDFLTDNDQFKISFTDTNAFPYQCLSALLCDDRKPDEALYVVELGRGRALTDLMASQYSVESPVSANPQSWVGIERIMEKESNCTCLYISYSDHNMHLWILKTNGVIHYRSKPVNEHIVLGGSVRNLDEFFAKSFRSFGILPEQDCEHRSLNDIELKPESSQQESPTALRLVEEDDEGQGSELSLFYKMIIAPVADLLEEPEIIIVPDRSLCQVPFAALIDESGKFLSETFRIRIVPSLTTLKLIQDSPADYHSQTGALIVGDPDVGNVFYKERFSNISRLPCARKEAEMIGRLLGVQPLLGQHATKQAVLQRINSVSLIHFAAHGNADRGEIALAPLCSSNRIPQEKDYLLRMSDISQVQLRAKLVVLSCCHSARGQIRAEGVVGIARAFLGSGARSVLVALWALGDSATEQFMNCFYEHLVRGESASESLDEAMKWMRGNGYCHVADWAPFMLIGDNVRFEFGK